MIEYGPGLVDPGNLNSAEIIACGTEVLLGQVLNTNAWWLARQLADLGINCYHQTVIGDHPERLRQAIEVALNRNDAVIITGGLGPTADDISLAQAARAAGRELVFSESAWQVIVAYFAASGRTPTENNRKQALLPLPCWLIPNHNGTAPGVVFTVDYAGKIRTLILLPGPPNENRPMFTAYVAPFLTEHSTAEFRHVYFHLVGIGEAQTENEIRDLVEKSGNPSIATYVSPGEVMIRLTQRRDKRATDAEVDLLAPLAAEVRRRFGKYIYEEGSRSLPEVVLAELLKNGRTLSMAESCTGGLISSELVAFPGASRVFRGSVVAYDNSAKERFLGVAPQVLADEGAVSEAVALQMAVGCRERFGSDYALAVTGIAGPEGGTETKPVGLVYIALTGGIESAGFCEKFIFRGERQRIRSLTATNALALLYRLINRSESDLR
ncbi:MAG: competence/damage-inducible protein A [Clostridiaceae bacterium]|nr:competence/damage-inducible protein A [Clostridiaceae bacterium]